MSLKPIIQLLTKAEKIALVTATAVFAVSVSLRTGIAARENTRFVPVRGGLYREALVGQPAVINPVISRNPADQDISALIYAPMSSLITSREVDSSGHVYTVKIAQDLKWSNKQPLTSDDIIFTIRTIQNPEIQSPLYKSWEGVVAERVSEIQVRFTLPAPYIFFPQNLDNTPVIPAHIYEKIPPANLRLSDYNLEPVGNGPYKFQNFAKKKNGFISEYTLTENREYSGTQPFLEKFQFKFYKTEEEARLAVRQKLADGWNSLFPISSYGKDDFMKTELLPSTRHYAIFFNQNQNPLLKDSAFRRALNDALDKQVIADSVFGPGLAKAVASPIITSKETEPPARLSLEEIRKKFEAIRKREGEIVLTLAVPDIDYLKATAEKVKAVWEAAGVGQLNIITLAPEFLLENIIKTNNYELLLFGNTPEKPEDIFPFWHSSERFYPGLNLALYNNKLADKLLEQIRQTDDREARGDLLQQLERLIIKDTPAVFLYRLPYSYLHNGSLKGFILKQAAIALPKSRFDAVAEWYFRTARVFVGKD